MNKVEMMLDGKIFSIETGRMAKQADGAVVVRYGDSVVLATATMSNNPKEGIDFFPLTVDFEERMYAVGKIPGGYIKREGRASEKGILTARAIDRPIRPMFPKHMRNEVQVIVMGLAMDGENQPDVMAINAASAALSISRIPFEGPIGGVRIGYVNDEFVLNPTYSQMAESKLDLILAGDSDGIVMMEAGAAEISESVMLQAIEFGKEKIAELIELQNKLVKEIAPVKAEIAVPETDEEIYKAVKEHSATIKETIVNPEKQSRESATHDMISEIMTAVMEKHPEKDATIVKEYIEKEIKLTLRAVILDEGRRPDGRKPDEIRQITVEADVLPIVHGTGLFTRGQTQVLTALTLAGVGDAQSLDNVWPETEKRYMHYYNFPPFSVGETRPMRSPGRREIGHGALAERALVPVLPEKDAFPYTMRLVSEVLESNGSSSMASTCASTIALMAAGVPIKAPVAGIAMGMVSDEKNAVILTDIQGVEDGSGDMDFKVTGTREGITAIQMDVKRGGLTNELMSEAFDKAKAAREFIIAKIEEVLPAPRQELSASAPRMITLNIRPDQIGEVIGPGGKVIKQIQADFEVKIDIEQDGTVFIAAADGVTGEGARKAIEAITKTIEEGDVYVGKVVKLADFGAFVELAPGRDGMVHISQIAHERIDKVEDVLSVGDEIVVKVIEKDPTGKIRLSRKLMLPLPTPGDANYVSPEDKKGTVKGKHSDDGEKSKDKKRPKRRF